MKNLIVVLLVICFFTSYSIEKKTQTQSTNPLTEFMDLKFGMFVHWGPVAIKGTEIGLSRGRQVTIEEITQKSNISPLDLYKLFSGN